MEKSIFVPCGDFNLEASISDGSLKYGAVLCHPHPLYGGDMDNAVVMAMKNGFLRNNFTVLRFNFRGVGRSGGSHAGGFKEVFDVVACYDFLKQKGVEEVWLGGYSFGAWVALKAIGESNAEMQIKGLVMVSPPVDFMDFSHLKLPSCPALIVVGSSDQLCSLESLKKWLNDNPASLVVVNGADHFFFHGLSEVENAVFQFVGSLKTQR